MKFEGIEIERFKHDTVMVKGNGKVVYVDPFQVQKGMEKADVIICTHEHYDHCSSEDVEKLKKEGTEIAGPKGVCDKISGAKELSVGKEIELQGVKISAVEAYNIGKEFHPRGLGIGVIVELAGVKVYHAGDTDFIPEMKKLKGKVEVAFLPVSGTYVMNAEEAVQAAEAIKPKLAVPMHYGAGVVGSEEDAEKFKEKYSGKAEILG